jgi:polygalacturonase
MSRKKGRNFILAVMGLLAQGLKLNCRHHHVMSRAGRFGLTGRTSARLGVGFALLFGFATDAGAKICNVMDFGATGKTDVLQTTALRAAIDACAIGGGTVVFPAGDYLTGTLLLKSHVYLQLEAGAVIHGSPNLSDYRPEGRLVGLIRAENVQDVGISGDGVIDGNADRFMDMTKLAGVDGPVAAHDRPGNMVVFSGSRDILVDGITLRNSPFWTLHLAGCDGAKISHVTVENDMRVPNNDGIHMTSSRNIRISDCKITTGDDAVAVTGLTDPSLSAPGFIAYPGPTENVAVSNCELSSRSAGLRVGYGEEGVRHCTFDNIVIHDSNRGIGIFVRDKGSISNIEFSNIRIDTRLHSSGWWGNGEPIHISALPMAGKNGLGRISDLRFSHIGARGENGIVISGSDESTISDVSLDDVQLTIHKSSLTERPGNRLDLRPGRDAQTEYVPQKTLPGLLAQHVERLTIKDFDLDWSADAPAYFTDGLRCEDFNGLTIDGYHGREAHSGGQGLPILFSNGRGAVIRNSRTPEGLPLETQ